MVGRKKLIESRNSIASAAARAKTDVKSARNVICPIRWIDGGMLPLVHS